MSDSLVQPSIPVRFQDRLGIPVLRGFIFVFFIGFFFSPKAFSQINPKAKEAFNKGNFEKAIELYEKDFQKISPENDRYQSLLYNLAEAYRLNGNYRMADSLHAMEDYTKTSYWGYALTLLQQYRADKCLKFVRYHLKFDPQHPELVNIEGACEIARNKTDDSKVILKTVPLPQKKERLIVPGFIIGMQNEKEAIQRFNEYAGKRKDKNTSPKQMEYPLAVSGIHLKGKSEMDLSLSNPSKVGFSIAPGHFTCFYNPAYYDFYKATSMTKKIFEPGVHLPDSLKSMDHHKEFAFYEHKEIVKQAWISQDKNVMVFSTNKLKGEGGYDLYMSTLTSNGWTKPVTLGSRVNTSYNEISPFISPNGILYFSSNGRDGQGGYDIYSYDLNLMDSTEVENLPKPFNSAFDDYGYLYHEQTGFGVFASTRPNGILSKQLFRFENKIVNCDANFVFKDFPEITTRNAPPKYCINFNMISLQDSLPKGKIFAWMMGDGKKIKGLKFSYCYAKPGIYNARLLIYDPLRKSIDTTQLTKEIVVTEKDFLRMEYSTKGKTAEFTTTSSYCRKCDNLTYYWDFGDGTYGCGFTAKHTYKEYGAYTVRLIMKFRKEKTERTFACFDRVIVEEAP
ncbi:MAG TPA: PKD domain-containing protein [Cytophagaceae bacterium]|nr:PKD domain-containing protein [Cytophagaceae bacterium]